MPLKLTTYYQGSEIPDFPGTNTFLRRSEIALSNETYWFRENPESHFLGNM